MTMKESAYIVRDINKILSRYDEMLLNISLSRNIECKVLFDKALNVLDKKAKFMRKYNKIVDLLESFTLDERQIYDLFCLQGKHYAEVCKDLNISERTFYRRYLKMEHRFNSLFNKEKTLKEVG